MKVLAGISPVVFHATEMDRAEKILKTNAFILVNSNFSGTETKLTIPGYDYFLSTARNRNSGYITSGGRRVLFTLDGRKLAQRYKGRPVDYWGESMRNVDKRYDEQEDRIFSKTPKIPNALSYMKDISVWLPEFKPFFVAKLLNMIDIAHYKNIPIHVYEDKAAFIAGNKKKAMNMQDLLEKMSNYIDVPENKYEEYDMSHHDGSAEIRGYINYIEILEYMIKHEIDSFSEAREKIVLRFQSDEEKKETKRVYDRARYKDDFINQLSATLQNARSYMTERTADAMHELTKIMRKYKANSFADLYKVVEKLNAELNEIDRRKRFEKAKEKFWKAIGDAGFSFKINDYNKEDVLKYLYITDFKYKGSSEIPRESWKELFSELFRIDNQWLLRPVQNQYQDE